MQYPYHTTTTQAGVAGHHQSCSVVYMPQPTTLRLGGGHHFIPDGLPTERLATSSSNSPSPNSQLGDAAAPPSNAPYSVQHMVKMEGTASPAANSNRGSTTSPACSSATPRTSIGGSVSGQEDHKSHEDEVREDEELRHQQQGHNQDRAYSSATAAARTDMPEVANNLPDAIFSDSMHAGPSMNGYEYADSAHSSPYHAHAGHSTATAGSSPASVDHRRGMPSLVNPNSGYVPLPTPPPTGSSSHHDHQQHHHHDHHHHQQDPHHPAATGGHQSAYPYSHYQGSGYHQGGAPDHHSHGSDHHRSQMGHRR